MDLLDQGQVDDIRQAFYNIADTFAFPVKIIKTTYTDAAFDEDQVTVTEEIELYAIRDYLSGSAAENDRYRNVISVQGTHEFSIYIGWHLIEANHLADDAFKILLDHNDLVEMEGEIYEIVAFAGIADMTKHPAFVQIVIRRRFQSPTGAAPPPPPDEEEEEAP